MNAISLISILLTIPGVFLTLAVHECAHGWASYQLGDPRVKSSHGIHGVNNKVCAVMRDSQKYVLIKLGLSLAERVLLQIL